MYMSMNNNAPEKLWIDPATDLPKLSGHIDKNSIEYTRTDAFIDKACAWLKENKDKYLYNTGEKGEYIPTCSGKMIEDFRTYMEE